MNSKFYFASLMSGTIAATGFGVFNNPESAFYSAYRASDRPARVKLLIRELEDKIKGHEKESRKDIAHLVKAAFQMRRAAYEGAHPEAEFTDNPLYMHVALRKNSLGNIEAYLVDDKTGKRIPINYLDQCGDIHYRTEGIIREVVDDVKYGFVEAKERTDYVVWAFKTNIEDVMSDLREAY